MVLGCQENEFADQLLHVAAQVPKDHIALQPTGPQLLRGEQKGGARCLQWGGVKDRTGGGPRKRGAV